MRGNDPSEYISSPGLRGIQVATLPRLVEGRFYGGGAPATRFPFVDTGTRRAVTHTHTFCASASMAGYSGDLCFLAAFLVSSSSLGASA